MLREKMTKGFLKITEVRLDADGHVPDNLPGIKKNISRPV